MSQEFKMNVNPLPAKTWNWLHMNGTALREATITQTGTVTVKKPESVTCTEGQDENIQAAETGMGIDLEIYRKSEKNQEDDGICRVIPFIMNF